MEPNVVPEYEELMLCGYCKQKFNDTDQSPKLLSCKHYFCLQCMRTSLVKGTELYCIYCWKCTEIGDMGPETLPTYNPVLCLAKNFAQIHVSSAGGGGGGKDNKSSTSGSSVQQQQQQGSTGGGTCSKVVSENCHTHAMPLALWCHTCRSPVCRACATTADHQAHQVKSQVEAREQIVAELQIDLASMNKMLSEIQRLAMQQREFLLKILEACVTLKTHVEADLTNNASHFELTDTREAVSKLRVGLSMAENLSDMHNIYSSVNLEKQRLQLRYQEMYLQCQLDDLIRNSTVIFDFQLLKQALSNIQNGEPPPQSTTTINNNNTTTFYNNNNNIINSSSLRSGGGGGVGGILPGTGTATNAGGQQNPILFLANYCMSQLYSRHMLLAAKQQHQHPTNLINNHNGYSSFDYHPHLNSTIMPPPPTQVQVQGGAIPSLPPISYVLAQQQQQQQQQQHHHHHHHHNSPPQQSQQPPPPLPAQQHLVITATPPKNIYQENNLLMQQQQQNMIHSPQMRNPPNMCPLYYFNIEVNGMGMGRIVIEVRADVAPKMAKNFGVLTTGEAGMGYKGCQIFQCWEGESVITGDFELNNGRGGRSIFEDSYFLPDDTKLMAVRGTVGMRRTQKRHDNLGMVGSQFRIILQEMRGFTGIFGHVIEGLELVEKISTYGDTAGKPTKNIQIAKCGKL